MDSRNGSAVAAAAPLPQRPHALLALPDLDRPPAVMEMWELEAVAAALPAKKRRLRETFDRLAACAPAPLPFRWEDLDTYISSLQYSVTLRHRQLREPDRSRPAPALAPAPAAISAVPSATGDPMRALEKSPPVHAPVPIPPTVSEPAATVGNAHRHRTLEKSERAAVFAPAATGVDVGKGKKRRMSSQETEADHGATRVQEPQAEMPKIHEHAAAASPLQDMNCSGTKSRSVPPGPAAADNGLAVAGPKASADATAQVDPVPVSKIAVVLQELPGPATASRHASNATNRARPTGGLTLQRSRPPLRTPAPAAVSAAPVIGGQDVEAANQKMHTQDDMAVAKNTSQSHDGGEAKGSPCRPGRGTSNGKPVTAVTMQANVETISKITGVHEFPAATPHDPGTTSPPKVASFSLAKVRKQEPHDIEEVPDVETEIVDADEKMQEGGDCEADDKIGNDGKVEEEARDDRNGNGIEDGKDAKWEDQDADEEMQVANEKEQSTEYGNKASLVKEEEHNTKDANNAYQGAEKDANVEDEHDTNMEVAVKKKASTMQGKEKEAYVVMQDAHEEEGAKNVTNVETAVAKEVSQDQVNQLLPGGFSDRTAVCTNMDAQRLVKLLFTNTGPDSEIHTALHGAPDAAALALHVIKLFLHDKTLKTNKAWVNCVQLIRMVPVIVSELSADTTKQAKPVAKDWKEMIDYSKGRTVLGSLASWGFLYFLISYNIASEFETKEIFRLFCTIPRKKQKKNYAMLFKGLRLTGRIPELMDYLIENGQQMNALYWAHVFNLVDKYSPAALLKGYVEKAKQTAIEISQKNMTRRCLSAIIKELDDLRRAQDLADQQITDSSLRTSIRAEINDLLKEFEKKKRSILAHLQQQHNKKHKKGQEHHEGQESQQQGQQSKPGEKLEEKLDKQELQEGQESQQQGQQSKSGVKLEQKLDKPLQKQQQKKQDKLQGKQQQSKQQHVKWSRQRTPKLPAPASTARNAPLRGHFGHPPYAAIHGVYHSYPAQAGWPGVPCVPPFAPQLGAPQYIPFNRFYQHP